MTGFISAGELVVAADLTTGAAIDMTVSESGAAVDRRINRVVKPLVSDALADDPTLTAAGLSAVNAAIVGKNLLEASRGSLTGTINLDAMFQTEHIGDYLIGSSTTVVNGPPITGASSLHISRGGGAASSFAVTQTIFSRGRQYWRVSNQASTGSWSEWVRGMDASEAGHTAAAAILDLARADGWTAVWDPTNVETLTITEAGRLTHIRDGLGNVGPMISSGGNSAWSPKLFGDLAGFVGSSLQAPLSPALGQPVTFLSVADVGQAGKGAMRYLIGGDSTTQRLRVFVDENDLLTIGAGAVARETRVPDGPMVVDVTFNGAESKGHVNGAYSFTGGAGVASNGTVSIRYGAHSIPTPLAWQGSLGPLLVYQGVLSVEKLNRMRKLLQSLTGIGDGPHPIQDGARIFSMDALGNPTFVQGDPDRVSPNGIFSMTKMINALTVRKFLTTDELLGTTTTVLAEDLFGGSEPRMQVGDVVTYRDLLYLIALPSDNSAPKVLARSIAETYLPGSKTAEARFVDEMNVVLLALGLSGANASTPGGTAQLSPRQVAHVLKAVRDDSVLQGIFGSMTHNVTVTGANARTYPVTSTLDDLRVTTIPYVCGKTGTGNTRAGLAVAWADDGGGEHFTAVVDVDSTAPRASRFREFGIAYEAVMNRLQRHVDFGETFASGNMERSTTVLDITDEVGATRESSGGGVFLSRIGSKVTFTVAAVSLPAGATWLIPAGFRPGHPFEYGTLRDRVTGTAFEVQVSGGTFRVYENPVDAVLRGSLTWEVGAQVGFPQAPLPGVFYSL